MNALLVGVLRRGIIETRRQPLLGIRLNGLYPYRLMCVSDDSLNQSLILVKHPSNSGRIEHITVVVNMYGQATLELRNVQVNVASRVTYSRWNQLNIKLLPCERGRGRPKIK